eukprot:scaffold8136_cov127-Cylindrotheca_fusiformis.AAC.20
MAQIKKSFYFCKEDFPEATEAEIARFVAAYGNGRGSTARNTRGEGRDISGFLDASIMGSTVATKLEAYLDWRMCYGLDYLKTDDEVSSDAKNWEHAVNKAWDIEESMKKAKELAKQMEEEAKLTEEEKAYKADYDKELADAIADPTETEDEKSEQVEESEDESANKRADLDQVIFFHRSEDGKTIQDKTDRRIIHVLPARINRRVAAAPIWANAFAFYLDRYFDRNSLETVTILLDVRAGQGWPNPPAITMVNFIRTVTKVLESNFPERVSKLIIFPVPRLAQGVFNTIKVLFQSSTSSKIVLVSGPASVDSPAPKEAIQTHIDGEVLDLTEEARLSSFIDSDEKPEDDAKSTGPAWLPFRNRKQPPSGDGETILSEEAKETKEQNNDEQVTRL